LEQTAKCKFEDDLTSLKAFISFLKTNKVFKGDVSTEDERGYTNRMIMQKLVFIAKEFGLDLGYNFEHYTQGPYSFKLSQDCRKVNKISNSCNLPSSFKRKQFLDFIYKMDYESLELASILLDLSENVDISYNEIVSWVSAIRQYSDNDKIMKVLNDILKFGIRKNITLEDNKQSNYKKIELCGNNGCNMQVGVVRLNFGSNEKRKVLIISYKGCYLRIPMDDKESAKLIIECLKILFH